jgi:hypothetical protein
MVLPLFFYPQAIIAAMQRLPQQRMPKLGWVELENKAA